MAGFIPREKKGIRLLHHANAPWARTGYGVQSNSLLPRLAKLPEIDEIALLAYYGIHGGVSEQEIGFECPVDHIKIKCYPARSDPWGNDVIQDHVTVFDADIVITLFDLWPLAPDFGWRGARWCLPYEELVQTDRGLLAIGEIVERRLPVKVLAETNGKAVWSPIEAYQIIPTRFAGPVVEIELESGKKLRVTGDNLVMTRDGWLAANKIRPNMEVRVVKANSTAAFEDLSLPEMPGPYLSGEYPETHPGRSSIYRRVPGRGWLHCDELQTLGQDEDRDRYHILQQECRCSELAFDEDSWEACNGSEYSSGFGRSRSGLHVARQSVTAVPDREKETGRIAAGIPSFSPAQQSGTIQCPIHGRTASDVFEDAPVEFGFERCRSITVCERQPSTVYDIKTKAGCFVAQGQLVHNCPWFPVDHEPIPPQVLERTQVTYENLVYSKSAAEELAKNGVKYTYIPHGVETTLYKPLSAEERRAAKRRLGFPEDCFLIGTVGANKGTPPRKGWNEMYLAIQEFIKDAPDPDKIFFYQHSLCTQEHGGPDLQQMATDFGLVEKTRFANPYVLQSSGNTTEEMNLTYNAMDVFILLSRGEGFGLPILEAQACGVPVIVTDWTACRELGEVGFKVPLAHKEWTPQRSFWGIADPHKAAEALREVYNMWLADQQGWGHRYQDLRAKAREFALPYDWQTLVDNNWAPLIRRLWSEIQPRIWGPMGKVWEDPNFGVPYVEEETAAEHGSNGVNDIHAIREISGNGITASEEKNAVEA